MDRLLAGELTADAAAQVRHHAARCAECGGLLDHAEDIAQRFATAPPPLRLPPPRAALVTVAATALVAAIALVVAAPWRGDPDVVRTKGRPSLGLFVAHGGAIRRATPGEVVAPGDQLQPVITAEHPGWIAVTAVDGAGQRTVYAAPQPIGAGRDRTLPFSIVLDATPGPTTLTAVFCSGPFVLEAVPDDCTSDAIALEIPVEIR
jgi:hypothetical protein